MSSRARTQLLDQAHQASCGGDRGRSRAATQRRHLRRKRLEVTGDDRLLSV